MSSSVPAALVHKHRHRKRWFPLESNPAVMTAFAAQLGFPTRDVGFCDVLSTDDWALAMVAPPVLAVVLLFPCDERAEAFATQQQEQILRVGQHVADSVFYTHQTIGNACGTFGILHAVGNAQSHVALAPGCFLERLFRDTRAMAPAEIAVYLENDSEKLEELHRRAADAGQSEQLEDVDDVITPHFVCFSHVEGHLYELDGSKSIPINHGPTTQETLLADACEVIKGFLARGDGDLRFSILALAGSGASESDDV